MQQFVKNARKTTHFSDCGALGIIVARPSKCGAHNWGPAGHVTPHFQNAGAARLLLSF